MSRMSELATAGADAARAFAARRHGVVIAGQLVDPPVARLLAGPATVDEAVGAGTVWVNAYGSIRPEVPFGGFGESGLGRELGAHGLAAYTEPKSLFVSV
jgi:hypothetical protein